MRSDAQSVDVRMLFEFFQVLNQSKSSGLDKAPDLFPQPQVEPNCKSLRRM